MKAYIRRTDFNIDEMQYDLTGTLSDTGRMNSYSERTETYINETTSGINRMNICCKVSGTYSSETEPVLRRVTNFSQQM